MERRRALSLLGLVGAALVASPVLVACTSGEDSTDSSSPSPSVSGSAVADPREAAARTESDLLTLAADIQARWPATSAVLASVQAAHAEHVTALTGATASPTPPTGPEDGRLPGTAAAALRKIAAAERAASTANVERAQDAQPSDARLLASLAAYSAAQDVVLTRASTTTGIGR